LATKWEWDKIRRLAAVVVIQTFLNFFLERDLAEMDKLPAKSSKKKAY